MVEDQSVREETHCYHYMGYFFRLATRILLYDHYTQNSIYHDSTNPVVEHWQEWEIVQWVLNEESIQRSMALWADALPQSYI